MGSKYIIKNATVVSVDKTIGNVENCDVLIEGAFISAVEPNLEHGRDCIVIDGTNAIVSPGFIDTHRHTWQTQLRTITTDYVLADYMLALRHIYGSCYSAHDAYMGNYCGALESIDNGITYLVDHSHIMNSPDHADAAVQGLLAAKIRAAFCYVLYTNPPWEGSCMDRKREEQTLNWRLEDAQRIQKKFFPTDDPGDLLRFGFGPSEAEITPPDQVAGEIQAARAFGAKLITAHVGMGQYDPGNGTVRNLAQRGALGPDLVLSHATTLQDDELDAVKKHGVGISSTPDTELQMGMGHPIAFKATDQCVHQWAIG
jgi:cytosine/adenosine deaminase-related metal-dependent hydrolase